MKCKKRLLKIGILCLMPLLALLLCLNNTYAWYIDDNNNMTSSNLSNVDNTSYTTSTYKSINIARIYVGHGNAVSFGLDYVDTRSNGGNGGIGFWYGDRNFNSSEESWTNIFNNQRIILNENVGTQNITLSNYIMPMDYLYIICGATFNVGTFNITKCMVNLGSQLLPYEPYGFTYINPNNIDLMQYLLGNNYFSHGRVIAYQTDNLNYWDRKLYPTNLINNAQITEETINQYISGNVLNLGTLCTDLLADLSTKSGYSTGNATYIALKPALAINGTATYPPVECRYIDLYIYCPNVLTTASCLIGGISDIDTSNHQRVNFEKQGDYIHIYFDEDNYNYIWDIDIQLYYSNGFVVPQNVRCDLENNPTFNMYDLGVESGYQKGLVDGKQQGYGEGRNYGYNEGYGTGYNVGYNEGASQNFETTGFRTLLTSILSYPVNLIRNSLNFEFMGVNIANIVMFIVSLGIVAFVIKEFKD